MMEQATIYIKDPFDPNQGRFLNNSSKTDIQLSIMITKILIINFFDSNYSNLLIILVKE